MILSFVLTLSMLSCTKADKKTSAASEQEVKEAHSFTVEECPVCKCELSNHTPKISISYIFEDGILTVCGNGNMEQLYIDGKAPWAEYATEIIEVKIYAGVKSIGAYAFKGCDNLKTVHIENGIESIENSAFFECRNIDDIKLPDTLKYIGDYAFNSCAKLTEATVPEGVTDIGEGAFALCEKLSTVKLPSTVHNLGELAFAGCSSNLEISVSESNQHYKYENKCLLTKDGTKLIYVNPTITEFTVPETVTHIGNCAFYNCLLIEKIKLPKSIKLIGSSVFDGCIKLTDIHYDGTASEWNAVDGIKAFAEAYINININVIPTCDVCGVTEHTVHPSCPDCGSYEHLEHPKLIMGHLSDEEILVLSKDIYTKFEKANRLNPNSKEHFLPLYKRDLGNSLTEEHISELSDLVYSIETPQTGFIPTGTLELINFNGENVSNQDWYTDRSWCIDFYSTNYNTMEEYKSTVSKYISQDFATRIEPYSLYDLFIFKGKMFLIGYARGYSSYSTLVDTAFIENRSENNLVITMETFSDMNGPGQLKHCSFIVENGNLVVDKVY